MGEDACDGVRSTITRNRQGAPACDKGKRSNGQAVNEKLKVMTKWVYEKRAEMSIRWRMSRCGLGKGAGQQVSR